MITSRYNKNGKATTSLEKAANQRHGPRPGQSRNLGEGQEEIERSGVWPKLLMDLSQQAAKVR